MAYPSDSDTLMGLMETVLAERKLPSGVRYQLSRHGDEEVRLIIYHESEGLKKGLIRDYVLTGESDERSAS